MAIDRREFKKREYTPSATCRLFHLSCKKIKGIRGPVGSGKSVACCLEVFLRSCGQEANAEGKRESKWLFYRRHAVDLELTTLQTWLEWFPETRMKYDSPMTGEYRCAHPSGDGTEVVIYLVMMGLETDEDIKKLKSLELSGAWGNEATQIPWKVHSTVYERLGRYPRACGGKKYPRLGLLMDTNSPHESNWWKRRSEDIRDENEEYFTQPPALLREWVERGDGVKGWKYTPNIGQRDGVWPAENVENHNEGFAYWLNMVRTKDKERHPHAGFERVRSECGRASDIPGVERRMALQARGGEVREWAVAGGWSGLRAHAGGSAVADWA